MNIESDAFKPTAKPVVQLQTQQFQAPHIQMPPNHVQQAQQMNWMTQMANQF